MNFPNHQHPVEDLSNSGEIGREIVRSDTAAEVIDIILPDPLDVAHGGTGVDTFTAGVVTASGTTPLDTVTGTSNVLPKWYANTLANSQLSETTGTVYQAGDLYRMMPDGEYSTSPVANWDGYLKYNVAGDRKTLARFELGKENATDGNDAGYFAFYTRTNGGSNSQRLTISSTGAVTISNLTASKFLKTDGSKVLTSTDITPGDITSPAALTRVDDTNVTLTLGGSPSGALLAATSITAGWNGQLSVARGGTGASTANGALTNLLPTQTGNAGKVLSTDGSVTSWISAGSAGTVTSVSVSSSDMTVTGSPVTTAGTIDLSLNTVGISKGGTGQTTANAALNALLPSQASNAGKVLSTDGSNTSWVAAGSAGTVTSVSVASTDLSVSGSPITASGTITLNVNNGAITLGKMADVATQTILGRNTAGTGSPEALSAATTKSILSLGNVENTALSTWAGSTNLTTLGTIGTGTWSASTIAVSKGGTGATTADDAVANLLPSQSGNSGKVLSTNGSTTSWISAGGTGTVTSVGLTSSDLTVGGASSPITAAGTYTLTLNTVPISKGGTGQTTASGAINALVPTQSGNSGKVLTTDGSAVSWAAVGGTGTVTSVAVSSSDLSVTGSPITGSGTITLSLNTVPISKGGTGATTATAGFDALSPMTTLGDTIYGGASGTRTRLAGNTTTTRKYLRQTGDGTYSTAPTWDTILASDIPSSGISTTNSDANLRLSLGSYYATSVLAPVTIDATWNGQLSIARGGTGQSTKATAFNALAPTTATGSMIYYDGTSNVERTIGTSGQVLTVSGGVPTWATPSASPTATSGEAFFSGGDDYTIQSAYAYVDFDNTAGIDYFDVALPSSGTFLVQAEFDVYTSNSATLGFRLYRSVDGNVSNSERAIAVLAGSAQQVTVSAIVTSTTSQDVRIQARYYDTGITAYVTQTTNGSFGSNDTPAYIRYVKLA